jgi:hypothetical protein
MAAWLQVSELSSPAGTVNYQRGMCIVFSHLLTAQ